MPRGMPSIKYRLYRYHCTEDYVCGYQRNEEPLVPMSAWMGDVSAMRSRFSPVRIEHDRITILQRVSTGEPFSPNEHAGDAKLVMHATFNDPVRPVYFAPGLLLKDTAVIEHRPVPRSKDFVEKEGCVTDCPGEVDWQYGGKRRFNESHP